jgi:hypothetical protein
LTASISTNVDSLNAVQAVKKMCVYRYQNVADGIHVWDLKKVGRDDAPKPTNDAVPSFIEFLASSFCFFATLLTLMSGFIFLARLASSDPVMLGILTSGIMSEHFDALFLKCSRATTGPVKLLTS